MVLFWLKERCHDAWLWPLNLGRDFSVRSGRLLQTLLVGGRALLKWPQIFSRAGKGQSSVQMIRFVARQVAAWLHLFLIQLFDLMGGPELCQFVMHLGMQTTPLTAAEQTVVQTLFGAGNLRYQDVRVAEGGILNLIFRYNGNLAFATWYTIHLPRTKVGKETAVSTRHNLALLIHELTHIYQYHHVGSRYLGEALYYLVTTRRDCYAYGGSPGLKKGWQSGKSLKQFNREQQAQIIQDYFIKSQLSQDISAYLPYLSQLRKREL